MNNRARPVRSALFVPGNRTDRMEKALKYGADALILDLEDSVPLSEKARAREAVAQTLPKLGEAGGRIFVRINALDTGLAYDDLEAVVQRHLYCVMIPKVSVPQEVREVETIVGFLERKAGIEPGSVLIDPVPETAQGLRLAYEIATASPRIAHMGAITGKDGDIARAVGFRWTPEGLETLFLLSKVLLDVRAAGVPYPIGGRGWWDIHDLEGLRTEAIRTKQLGYMGMMLIHPSHVEIVNQVFTPTSEEIERWKGLVEALERCEREGSSVLTYRGEMVDIAHAKAVRQMLDWARALGVA